MILAHFSDTHGLPRKVVPDNVEAIVLSGDIAPNKTRGAVAVEEVYQESWFRKTGYAWKAWAKDLPVILVRGNHDFVDVAKCLREAGVRVVDVEMKTEVVCGVRFAGISDIPWMGGEWHGEYSEETIWEHMQAVWTFKPDVLVSHCPPKSVFDRPYDVMNPDYQIGSEAIDTMVRYSDHRVKAVLFGHCHEQGGKTVLLDGVLYSNAATTRNLVRIW